MDSSQEDKEKINFNVYVGSERGILKGVRFGRETPLLKNFNPSQDQLRENHISSLSWTEENNKELLVGFEDGNLKYYNPKIRSFTSGFQIDVKSPLVGVHQLSPGIVVTGYQNGRLNLYSSEKEKNVFEISTGSNLCAVKQFKVASSIFATGGEENDLKIYDVSNETSVPIFKAKNIPHDFLDLRVPVWVQDLSFINESPELVGICSRHGHIRLYDVKAGLRPVTNFKIFEDEGLMALCDTGQSWQVVVGGNKGGMALADLRFAGKGKLVHKYSAASGSVRSIDFKKNYIVSCGLDRHLYLYNMHEKKAIKKLYLKTRLTRVIMTDDFNLDPEKHAAPSSWDNIEGEVINKKRKRTE